MPSVSVQRRRDSHQDEEHYTGAGSTPVRTLDAGLYWLIQRISQ